MWWNARRRDAGKDSTAISEDVKTEEDFLKLRDMERNEYIENQRRADLLTKRRART